MPLQLHCETGLNWYVSQSWTWLKTVFHHTSWSYCTMNWIECSSHERRLYTTEKRVNAILMAVVPTVFCGNIDKNRCPFWSKQWFMEVNIHLYTPSQIGINRRWLWEALKNRQWNFNISHTIAISLTVPKHDIRLSLILTFAVKMLAQ